MNYTVKIFQNYPVNSNCYLIYNEVGSAIIIDPATIAHEDLHNFIQLKKLTVDYCFCTHGHFDHILGLDEVQNLYNPIFVFSTEALKYLQDPKKNLSVFHGNAYSFSPKNFVTIDQEQQSFEWQGDEISVLKTPGHTNSCISIKIGTWFFVGDLLIKGEKTVTKLPTGNKMQVEHSLKKIASTDDVEILYCGHGEPMLIDELP